MKKMILILILILIMLCFISNGYADIETEPNNTMDTSDKLVSGNPMTGQLSSETDEDWFNYSVTAPDIINIQFTTEYCTKYSCSYYSIIKFFADKCTTN